MIKQRLLSVRRVGEQILFCTNDTNRDQVWQAGMVIDRLEKVKSELL